jgi:hypothetical protein
MITPPSSGILRPSQRVSNIFQTFAEGGIPTVPINGKEFRLGKKKFFLIDILF